MGNKNVDRFINSAIFYFKFIGFEFEDKHRWMKVRLIWGLLSTAFVVLGQVIFMIFSDVDVDVKTTNMAYLNYYLMSVGKVTALLYNRKTIFDTLNEFRQIYPSVELEKAYNLHRYLKQFLLIENILAGFFHVITLLYCIFPLLVSMTEVIRGGVFVLRVPLKFLFPFKVPDTWPFYILIYWLQVQTTYESATTILGLDLCLFSSLLQLSMHFEIITKNILQIEPDGSDMAEKKLKEQIVYHQRVLRLAEKVNYTFTPSVIFSLLSSSLIFCFTGYDLLGDIHIIIVAKAVALLAYELKQVIIICFLGDRLIQTSCKISEAIYEHKWYNGTSKYKRLVLVILRRSQKSSALYIAGISEISLQTFRVVMSISYQIFTVLRTRKI